VCACVRVSPVSRYANADVYGSSAALCSVRRCYAKIAGISDPRRKSTYKDFIPR